MRTRENISMQAIIDYLNHNHNAFTSIGVILTFLVAITTLAVTRKNNKLITFAGIVAKNKIDAMERLQLLVSQYVSIAKVNFYSSTKSLNDNTYFQKMLELSTEIRLLLGASDATKELTSIIGNINQSYETLIYTYSCIESCGEKLFSHVLDESICTNPFFIKYLFVCAKEKQIHIEPAEKYVGNIERVIDLFREINQSPNDVDLFLEQLIGKPEHLILQLNNDLDQFVLAIIKYIECAKQNLESTM